MLTIVGKCRDIGLGGFPMVGLADAREQALENRRLARRGGDSPGRETPRVVPMFPQRGLDLVAVDLRLKG